MSRMRMRPVVMVTVVVTAGCGSAAEPPVRSAPVVSASSAPSPSPSPSVDPAAAVCREVERIVAKDDQVRIDRLYDLGERGAESADPEIRLKSQLLRDFAAVTSTRIRSGADPARSARELRGALQELVEACATGPFVGRGN